MNFFFQFQKIVIKIISYFRTQFQFNELKIKNKIEQFFKNSEPISISVATRILLKLVPKSNVLCMYNNGRENSKKT